MNMSGETIPKWSMPMHNDSISTLESPVCGETIPKQNWSMPKPKAEVKPMPKPESECKPMPEEKPIPKPMPKPEPECKPMPIPKAEEKPMPMPMPMPVPTPMQMPEELKPETCVPGTPQMVLAMAYVLDQTWGPLYEPDVAFGRYTLFPDLDKPFIGEEMPRK